MKYFFPVLPLLILSAVLLVTDHRSNPEHRNRSRYEWKLREIYRHLPASDEDRRKAMPDQPGMAAFTEYLMTFDPATGKVPRERRVEAYLQTRQFAALKNGSLTWTGIGSDMGGRTRMMMADPSDPSQKKVWAGGITGGLWYNNDITNRFSAWIAVGDFWPNLSIRCMTYDPNDFQVFYIGTGEAETALITYRESSGLGEGIWKSSDGGVTWNQLPSTINFAYVTSMVVRNENGQSVVYAGVASGTYQGTQHQSQPSDGLYRSVDGGATWTQVLPVITGSDVPYAVSDIVLGADNRIYAGSRPNLEGEGGAVILFSDDGISWQVNEDYQNEIENDPDYPLPGRVVLAASASDASSVYALVSSGKTNSGTGFNAYYCFHILRSNDRGVSWIKKNLPLDLTSGDNFATIAWHALAIGVDPANPENVFIGGLDVHKSVNGGTTWNRISDWSLMYAGGGPRYVHADIHSFLFRGGSSDEILIGTDGGVFFTASGTSQLPVFAEHNADYNTLQFYTCDITPQTGLGRYIGGLQDNGSLYFTGSPLSIFNIVSGGDGAFCFYDKNDPALFLTSIYYNRYYVFKYGSYINYIGNWYSGTFINPADLDHNMNILYANAVDYSGGHTDQILRLKNLESGTSGVYLNVQTGTNVPFSAVKYSPYSSSGQSTLYLGSPSGRLFKVTGAQSGNPQSEEIGFAGFPDANISAIAIGGSGDTLLVTFSNYGVSSVWQTTDGGATWQEKEGNLPDMPVRWALYHPLDADNVLLATETGVWQTNAFQDEEVVWTPASDGMANVRVDMLKLRESDYTLLAATHGRGLFTAEWDITTGVPRAQAERNAMRIYPNPSQGFVSFGIPDAGRRWMVTAYDHAGKVISETVVSPSDRQMTATLDLTGLIRGICIITLVSETGSKFSGKVLIY